jgi:hypothetical protein
MCKKKSWEAVVAEFFLMLCPPLDALPASLPANTSVHEYVSW